MDAMTRVLEKFIFMSFKPYAKETTSISKLAATTKRSILKKLTFSASKILLLIPIYFLNI